MKKNIAFLALTVAYVLIGQAHAQQLYFLSPEEKAKQSAEHMQKRLGLKEMQIEQIYTLNLVKIQKVRTIKSQKTITPKKLDRDYKEIREEYNTRLRSVLTPEQYQRWEILKDEANARRKVKQHQQEISSLQEAIGDETADPESELEGIVTE
ncbi:MAG TPA: hypothetical protein VK750_10865 [Cytophagaceae bacterium]|jgi:hypothetical protein|nr:hypothetical protein [Cytophagaceae bacterium]